MGNKLCLIFNIASHYRESIFNLIEQTFPCDWYFGSNDTDIKVMDTSKFRHVVTLPNKQIGKTRFSYREGVTSLISNKEYQSFLLTGETFNLSIWLFLIKAKFFYPKKKIYIWTHGWYGKESLVEKFLKKIYYKLTDGIFLYGNYAKKLLLEEGVSEEKLYVIHNSLQYDKHLQIRKSLSENGVYKDHFLNSNKNIIFIGRLTKVKKLDFLISALEILQKQGLYFNLTFVGDGVEMQNLKNIVKDKGLTEFVWFYGACYDDQQNAKLIYNADVCVSPGNVGLTAIHTMTFGTPVLTHNNFPMQMPEFETIIKGVTGDFFEQNNIGSLVICIKEWFEKNPNREAVRQACYKEIETSWTPDYQLNVLKSHLDCFCK